MKKMLTDVNMEMNGSSSFLASTAGVLRAAGLWKDEFYKLAGMTGMAFHFLVHEQICPSAVTVYDWQQEHFQMLDRVGIQSEGFNYFYNENLNTYSFMQTQAVKRIKESIDRGVGVVIWTPTPLLEFGIIFGYDDEEEVFMVKDVTCSGENQSLPYQKLGFSQVPILAYRIFHERVEVPEEKAYWESLRFGLGQWEKELHIRPEYASGRRGYHNFIQALKAGEFDPFGLAYIIFSYNQAKQCLFQYLEFLATEVEEFAGLKQAAELYGQVVEQYKQMAELVPFGGPGSPINMEVIPQVLTLVETALEKEEQAMIEIAKLVQSQGE